ncbi:MAG: pantetheine-phosphate adenylyltransferase [Marinifilaceae bacterium]
MKKVAVFPGSFDPFTVGHEEIVRRGLTTFDKIIIAVGINAGKKNFMSLKARIELIKCVFADVPQVTVDTYSGLTVDYCRKVGANILLRGLRTAADFEYERAIGQANRAMDNKIETMLMLTSAEHTFISSSIVRNVFENGGDVNKFLPSGITTDFLHDLINTYNKK